MTGQTGNGVQVSHIATATAQPVSIGNCQSKRIISGTERTLNRSISRPFSPDSMNRHASLRYGVASCLTFPNLSSGDLRKKAILSGPPRMKTISLDLGVTTVVRFYQRKGGLKNRHVFS